ncbi:hypothetical protein PUNSTDRAFT_100676 [Punctularia strigosozonata HHB-11173 SS5]|uniref:uncharacterized protein n=1 Tax=Punctularia strigosozonata (strain HHB-11173) TaxID=741275 RepID=UPI00044174F8|nr:uncharacterized protein PUNSTDRAFT_100676 [Punctularia strigosozonata HHB-11173 SS5]EIN10849.1 hypothetical protein PUNSTDRAFT_100676 [Punctularia strigosozonata HHB-11173 SS5]
MFALDHDFLFASFGDKQPSTTRRTHIRRLYDILQLSIQRNHLDRARRAWAILIRCKEFDWKTMWMIALHICDHQEDMINDQCANAIALLKSMMRQNPNIRETILREIIVRQIRSGQHRTALNDLEFYLPSFPFHDNAVLHLYAGMLALYLAQINFPGDINRKESLLRDAQGYLERSNILDTGNIVARVFLEQLPEITRQPKLYTDGTVARPLSDEEDWSNVETQMNSRQKRIRGE